MEETTKKEIPPIVKRKIEERIKKLRNTKMPSRDRIEN